MLTFASNLDEKGLCRLLDKTECVLQNFGHVIGFYIFFFFQNNPLVAGANGGSYSTRMLCSWSKVQGSVLSKGDLE